MQLRIDPEVPIDCLLHFGVLFYLPATADVERKEMWSYSYANSDGLGQSAITHSDQFIFCLSTNSILYNDSSSGQ